MGIWAGLSCDLGTGTEASKAPPPNILVPRAAEFKQEDSSYENGGDYWGVSRNLSLRTIDAMKSICEHVSARTGRSWASWMSWMSLPL